METQIRLAPLRTTTGKPDGYYEDFVNSGRVEGDFLFIEQEVLATLLQKYAAIPIIKTEWPAWAKALKKFSTHEDNGAGDTVARLIGNENSEKFKAWHKTTFGKDCGCTGRQASLNRKYPYK